MADDTDPWTQRFQNINKLVTQQPAAPAGTTPPTAGASASTAPAARSTALTGVPSWMPSWMVPGGADREGINAFVGGAYNVASDITRNLGGTPNPLPADAQAAMAAHPYLTTAGNIAGGTVAAIPLAMGAEVVAPAVGLGTGLGSSIATGAVTGAAQNALAGNPDESLARRAVTGAALGGTLGAIGNRVGNWFGAGKSIPSEVADAAKVAQQEGVTDIGVANLPGRGDIKAMGSTPTYSQSGQIDNAVGKILGEDVPDFKPANLKAAKDSIGGDVTAAAKSGQINVAPGGAVDQALTQVQQFANANGAGAKITPLINQIRGRIQNGVISGQDFDNLVGAGSPLHDLIGDVDNPFVKQAAQALDKVMDAGFEVSSPLGAYDAWVDARTRYRMLMGVEKAVLPNGHINPTTLFNAIQNRFTDLKGVPLSSDPLVGRMGQFADSIRTLFGGSAAPAAQGVAPGFWKQAAAELGVGGAPAIASAATSGNIANPENYLTPAGLAGILAGVGTVGAQLAGRAYQQSPRFANALINAGGSPIANPLVPYASAIGTQAFPQRQN
jgi:hypothetical protein